MNLEPDYELVPKNKFRNIIKVIGVGGAGCNAVKHMHNLGVNDIGLVICNTDQQALESSSPELKRLQIGIELTKGLGAGTEPIIGKKAAEENETSIRELLKEPTEMVFITAGMGGGTGTGAAPVIARIAREMNLLTIAVVTDPFPFEGLDKIEQAKVGIEELKKYCDTVLIIKNQRLEEQFGDMDIEDAYAKADDVLANGVKSIAEFITRTGVINLDFADVKKVLGGAGQAVMGTAEAEGPARVEQAIKLALSSPLLESNDISGAQRILVSIAYSPKNKIKLSDQTLVTTYINDKIQIKAKVFKHGFAVDENLGEKVRVTIVAAGFDLVAMPEENPPLIAVQEAAPAPFPKPSVNEEKELEQTENEPISVPIVTVEEQIKIMISKFMREGYRNPLLTSTPTYQRNGIKLKDPLAIRQKGKISEHNLGQLWTMLQT